MKKLTNYRRVKILNSFGLLLAMLTTFPVKAQVVDGAAIELEIVRAVRMSFQTEAGKQYQILSTIGIGSADWVASGDPIEGNGEVYTFTRDSDQTDKTFFKVEEIRAELEEFVVVDLEMAMIPIPDGTFVMGTPTDEEDRRSFQEGPQTTVTISKPFWMSKYVVTQGQYERLVGNNPSRFTNVGLNAPVEQVSWLDAVAFCELLTDRERTAGRLSDEMEYRLPTEAQWEYACRAGTTTRFSYGDDPDYSQLGEYAWYRDNSGEETHRVGLKLPNPWGLYDMYGNVAEWVLDIPFRLPGGSVVDPMGPENRLRTRVVRGSAWNFPDLGCRSGHRNNDGPPWNLMDPTIGLRPVLVSVQ